MANLSYTYTLTNGTTADAPQVMTNFNDAKDAITDGTKDITVNILTANGISSLKDIIPVADATYDLGSGTFRFKDVYLSGEMKGERVIINGGANYTNVIASNTYYVGVGAMNIGTTAKYGFTATRAGSIVALGLYVSCTSYTATGTITGEVYKNGASVFALSALSISAAGDFQERSTQARAVDTFVAGDKIQLTVTGSALLNSSGHVTLVCEVILDS